LRNAAAIQQVRDLVPDIFIDVAYGLFIPEEMLHLPRYHCINVHPSLLPRWRGASPIQAAILAGDEITGVSIIRLSQKLDAGDILQQQKIVITECDTAATLLNKTAKIGAQLLLETLTALENNRCTYVPQNDTLSTYAPKIEKADAALNWNLSAIELERRIRAYNPWPVAYAIIKQQTVRIWEAQALAIAVTATSGTIVNASKSGIDVATNHGTLRLTKLQFSGKKPLTTAEIINGHSQLFAIGQGFEKIMNNE